MATSSREMFDDVVCYDEEVECNLIDFKALVIERHGNRERERERVRSEATTPQIQSPPAPRGCVALSRSEWRSDGPA
jgi:hypothetical protein